MSRGEIFSGQVRDPVMDLVVTLRDKFAPLLFQGMEYEESGISAISVMGEVLGL